MQIIYRGFKLWQLSDGKLTISHEGDLMGMAFAFLLYFVMLTV